MPGYSGEFCSNIDDYCLHGSDEKCYNGGRCQTQLNNFTCDCLDGFKGPRCEEGE